MAEKPGTLYLIPAPLHPDGMDMIPTGTLKVMHALDAFIVEEARTARRYLRAAGHPRPIDELSIEPMAGPDDPRDLPLQQLGPLLAGKDMGILSEAGLPGVADPGQAYVRLAHLHGARVAPLAGPSSIFMSLMASGLEGQRFTFHGYLSAKKAGLAQEIRDLEKRADRDDATQIWIEAPYRNRQVLEAVAAHAGRQRMFCIAAGIGGEDASILTMRVEDWLKRGWPEVHKVPAVFLLR
jgi:16S rRNA (cytidine1402-2'-O)-methyltransferase